MSFSQDYSTISEIVLRKIARFNPENSKHSFSNSEHSKQQRVALLYSRDIKSASRDFRQLGSLNSVGRRVSPPQWNRQYLARHKRAPGFDHRFGLTEIFQESGFCVIPAPPASLEKFAEMCQPLLGKDFPALDDIETA
jgi:hypothetical protein